VDAQSTERQALPASLSFFANAISPFETHSIWFGPDGMPSRRDLSSPVTFTFECCGFTFVARAGRQAGSAWLEIEAELGTLPFTAQSRAARGTAIAVLIASKLTDHRYFGVGPDQRIKLSGELPLDPPLTPAVIQTGVTQFVIAVRPIVELLNEAVALPPDA
jgi:hypothetical protein